MAANDWKREMTQDQNRNLSLEERVERLEASLEAVRHEIDRIGGGEKKVSPALQDVREPRPSPAPPPPSSSPSLDQALRLLPLVGRAFIILGGGYLIRALTEGRMVSVAVGVAMGLAYALIWLLAADRAAARAQRASATIHLAESAMVGFPLLWEVTVRFHFFGPVAALFIAAGLALLVLFVSWRRELASGSWVVAVASLATAAGLLPVRGASVPVTVFLIGLSLATIVLRELRGWRGSRWLTAPAADLAVLLLVATALHGQAEVSREWAAAIALALLVTHLFLFVFGSLRAGRRLGAFAVIQTVLVVGIGLGGALALVEGHRNVVVAICVASAALGVAAYGLAFSRGVREGEKWNLAYYSSLALVLVLIGVNAVASSGLAAAIEAALALVAWFLAPRLRRSSCAFHAAVFLLAAAYSSQLLMAGVVALVLPVEAAAKAAPIPIWPVSGLALAAAAMVLWSGGKGRPKGRLGSIALVGVWFVLIWGSSALALSGLGDLLFRAPAGPPDAALVAAIRTVWLSVLAALLAWSGRWPWAREGAWLVYPLLLLTAVKFLAEDLPNGRASTLFVALACFGLAIVLAARWTRSARKTV